MAAAYELDTSQTAWVSRGFEVLADRVYNSPNKKHFDVLIVGSGYGGAVAADSFAGWRADGEPITVAVLERGKEYLSGAFPVGLRELPRHIRGKKHKEGLFDIRLGPEATTVVANGLGGGSLINAGVMEVPAANVFAKGWPAALSSLSTLQQYFAAAQERLGSRLGGVPNTIRDHPDGLPQKYRSLESIAPRPAAKHFRAAEITIAMTDTRSSGNVALQKCVRCGDCATGCNFGAKNSLDLNLLVRAQQKGAEIFSGATVLLIERDVENELWIVHCVHTNAKLRARHDTGNPATSVTQIRAANVVLAAGTLGSTEILLRSKQAGLALSERLGQRCSTNGDMLIARYDTKAAVHTVADEAVRPSQRAIGPTITGVIDLRTADGGVVIEEMSVPAGLRRVFTEIFATINTLHGLDSQDWSTHRTEFASGDLYSAPAERIERTALYAVMGDDGAAGTIKLPEGELTLEDDGVAGIRWPADEKGDSSKPALQDLPLFETQVDTLGEHTKHAGGRLIPNPVWKLLPKDLEWLLKDKRGPLTTVHPLGGCAMADSAADGVVDDCGRVFDPRVKDGVHDGLAVLDGSIIPTALGINPALTITAVALRAADALADGWGYDPADGTPARAAAPLVRPVLRATDVAFTPQPTEVEIIERLAGPVKFRADGHDASKTRIVEVTLRFAPKAVADLCGPPRAGREPVLRVADEPSGEIRSRIRIYDEIVWREMEKRWSPAQRFERELEAIALFSAPLSGSLRVLERTRSWALVRIARAGWAWFLNRGKRDIYQAFFDKDEKDTGKKKSKSSGIWARIKSGVALASRSGEVRALVYDLDIGAPDAGAVFALKGTRISGRKRFTYSRRGNPWRQLMEVELDEFPGLEPSCDERVIELDLRHLARIGVPLFRITKQEDGATALAEIASFFGYFIRLLLGLHIWSFRAPDEDTSQRKPDLLPTRNLPGLPGAEVYEVPLDPEKPEGGKGLFKGKVILTRYPNASSAERPPLLMLHGYSASGTTFAHHAVPDNFASHFWKSGRDVWIADLRTSSGQKESAQQPWSFEQIGTIDVPAVFKDILTRTQSEKLDVIAHCMGTVVFSMAVLGGFDVAKQVRRAAFTQVGPLVVFSPANIFRGYVLRYLIDFLPEGYSFRPEAPTLADDLLDRLLATLPYPVEEFDIENPTKCSARTPWTRTRHRMDALYGRDFNVANMEPEMLRCIDDHFGALSLRTVAQTLHFVHYSMITDFHGVNSFVSRDTLKEFWGFPTFSVHGAANGLAHVSTVDRMRAIFADAGRAYRSPHVIEGAGHQDALIGNKRAEALAAIEQFLDDETEETPREAETEMVAYPPWIGPIITERLPTWVDELTDERKKRPVLVIRLAPAPTHRTVEGVVMIRVGIEDDRIVRPDDPTKEWDVGYVTSHMAFYHSNKLVTDRWDAFVAPLPEHMPGSADAARADGLLVLLVYSESKFLAPDGPREHAYFRANAATGRPEYFLPLVGAPGEGAARATLKPGIFERAAKALSNALRAQSPPTATESPFRARPGHPVLVRAPDTASLELPIEPIPDPPPLPPTARLVFGTNTASGAAVLGAVDYDPGVADGFIPYHSPQNPPSDPPAAGTSFALLSCQYPGGFLDEPVAYASYRRVLDRIGGAPGIQPRFLVLTGDQVYVDPTAGLYDPSAQDGRYSRPYESWLRQSEVRSALRRVPSFMLLDDHEIDDNWEPLPDQSNLNGVNNANQSNGVVAYRTYQRAIVADDHPGDIGTGQSFAFRLDGFPFFMLDTRSQRTLRRVGELKGAKLFDDATLAALKAWLSDPQQAGPKFVVTPAMLLPRHRHAVQHAPPRGGLDPDNLSALHSDGWDGYPNSLREVLGFIAEKGIQHVVFLSGDEHRGCIAKVELCDGAGKLRARVHSLHTTAAYAPFTFANSLATAFVFDETIDFVYENAKYQCVVEAEAPQRRDGALLLRPRQDNGVWKLDYEYADGGVVSLDLSVDAANAS